MSMTIEIEFPDDLIEFSLPEALNERLQNLLDKQDGGDALTEAERGEAEGLVKLSERLSFLKLRARRIGESGEKE